jgi:replicative DNA helicase
MIESFPSGSRSAPQATDLLRSPRIKPALADPAKVDRLPPHSIEAEQGVLGCILLSPIEGLGDYMQQFREATAAFYDLRHQVILECIIELAEAHQPIDLLTLHQRLKDRNQIESVGGLPYLNSLVDAVPSAANLNYYLEIVRDKYLLRRMIQACTGAIARIHEHEGDVDALMDEIERDVLHISEERGRAESPTIRDLVHGAITTIEKYHQGQGKLTGLETGFQDLDRLTSGLHDGEMIVIAARPSMGKTSLAMNIAEHVVLETRQPVGVFSLEMTAEQLVLRVLCSRARVNLRDVREGFLAERDFPKLTSSAGQLAKSPLFVDDSPGLSILQLRARARRMYQQHKIRLFVIDYLQLLHSTSARRVENRQQEIADISNGIKALAKELNVPVIVLSQLNRELEKDRARKPRLSDLRESGAIEQDADVVGLLYRPVSNEDDDGGAREDADGYPVNLLIAKQRNGPTGDVPLTFLKGFTRFVSAAKVSAEDVPDPR